MVNLSNRIIISRIFLTQFIVQVNVHYCSLLEMCAHDIVNRARTTYNVFEFIHVDGFILNLCRKVLFGQIRQWK